MGPRTFSRLKLSSCGIFFFQKKKFCFYCAIDIGPRVLNLLGFIVFDKITFVLKKKIG